MKKVTISLVLAVLTLTANAKKEKADTLTIGQVAYRITYKTKSVNDTTKIPYRYRDDDMRLDIGQNGVSRFYSQSMVIRQEMLKNMYKSGGGFDLTKVPKGGSIGWELYKNYPAEGKTLQLDKVGSDKYQTEEPMEVPEWEMVPDSTQEILGYQCQMAKTRFKGRQWNAWFTEDIPLDEGPWKLHGLPGLVLKAYDARQQYIFEGAGLEQLHGEEVVTLVNEKREKISQKDLRKLRDRYDPSAALAASGVKVISVKNSDGSEGKLPNKMISNSIELE